MNPKSLLLSLGMSMLLTQACLASSVSPISSMIHADDSTYTENYIIIGTYSMKINAENHMQKAKTESSNAGMFYNAQRNMYYVFAYKSGSRRQAVKQLHQLRKINSFRNAWLYSYKPPSSKLITNNASKQQQVKQVHPTVVAKAVKTNQTESSETIQTVDKTAISLSTKQDLINKEPKTNSQLVAHNTQTIETEKVAIKSPTFNTQLKVQSSTVVMQPVEVLDHVEDIIEAQSGEIIVLQNVLFYRNAAVMKPSAEYELRELLSILKQHPSISITIHGHTNGDFRGEIIRLSKRDKDYFHLSSRNEELQGNASLLSIERADLVKKYLERNGILSGRINTIGWGGVQPLYPASSTQSIYNSRIEIEIMSR